MADAPGLGPGSLTGVEVRVLSPAPKNLQRRSCSAPPKFAEQAVLAAASGHGLRDGSCPCYGARSPKDEAAPGEARAARSTDRRFDQPAGRKRTSPWQTGPGRETVAWTTS